MHFYIQRKGHFCHYSLSEILKNIHFITCTNMYLQMEGLIVFWWPVIGLRLGGMLSLLVCKMWSNEVHFYKRTEHTRHRWPFEIICCHHCKKVHVNILLKFSLGFLGRTLVPDTLVCYGWNGSIVRACTFWTHSSHGDDSTVYLDYTFTSFVFYHSSFMTTKIYAKL